MTLTHQRKKPNKERLSAKAKRGNRTAVFGGPANSKSKQSWQYISPPYNKRYQLSVLSMKLSGVIAVLFELSADVPVFI